MVYTREDGTQGFSWKLQHDFLLREHPEMLEEIAHSRFEMLAEEQPEQAAYYKDLGDQLSAKINTASDQDKDFGYVQSDIVTKAFVKENNLIPLFADVPGLSTDIDTIDLSYLDDEEPDVSALKLDDEIDLSFLGESDFNPNKTFKSRRTDSI